MAIKYVNARIFKKYYKENMHKRNINQLMNIEMIKQPQKECMNGARHLVPCRHDDKDGLDNKCVDFDKNISKTSMPLSMANKQHPQLSQDFTKAPTKVENVNIIANNMKIKHKEDMNNHMWLL